MRTTITIESNNPLSALALHHIVGVIEQFVLDAGVVSISQDRADVIEPVEGFPEFEQGYN